MMIDEGDKDFARIWQHYSPLVQKALDHSGGLALLEDVRLKIMRGEAQFWPVRESVMITEFIYYPRKTALNCWLIAGNFQDLRTAYASIIRFAKQHGCHFLTGGGRQGWGKIMAAYGWQTEYHYRYDLTNEVDHE